MTSAVEIFRSTQQQFSVARRTLVREQINISVVPVVVVQSIFKVVESSNEISVAPQLEERKR
jgi:hypothetical protein